MRQNFLPFLRECINALDEEGALLSDNFLMSELLLYGVRDAQKKNRISLMLSFPDMLPHSVVNAISILAKSEQEAEERHEMRVEDLQDWLTTGYGIPEKQLGGIQDPATRSAGPDASIHVPAR